MLQRLEAWRHENLRPSSASAAAACQAVATKAPRPPRPGETKRRSGWQVKTEISKAVTSRAPLKTPGPVSSPWPGYARAWAKVGKGRVRLSCFEILAAGFRSIFILGLSF